MPSHLTEIQTGVMQKMDELFALNRGWTTVSRKKLARELDMNPLTVAAILKNVREKTDYTYSDILSRRFCEHVVAWSLSHPGGHTR